MMSKIAKKKVPRNFLMMYQSIFFKDIFGWCCGFFGFSE